MENKEKIRKQTTKWSLLSVSLFVVSGGAIAGNLPAIALSYPHVNDVFIELITTIPSLFIVLTVAVSHRIAKRIGYKKTVNLGLLCVGISSFVPVLVDSFILFFISRIIFGVGIGLFNPLLYRFSSELYSDNKLSAMIGLQSTFEGIGGMFLTFLVGQLLKINWEVSFLAYALAFPVIIIFNKNVPNIKKTIDKDVSTEKAKLQEGHNWALFTSILLLMIIVTIYMSVTVKMTNLLLEKGVGDATDGSNMIALIGLGAMLAGVSFGSILANMKEKTILLSFIGLATSMFGLYISKDLFLIGIFSLLSGFSFRLFIPYLFNLFNQMNSEESEKNTSLLLIAFNVGVAFSPISLSIIQRLFNLNKDSTLFLVEFYFLLALIMMCCLAKLLEDKEEKRKES